jgi:hypothetical protein
MFPLRRRKLLHRLGILNRLAAFALAVWIPNTLPAATGELELKVVDKDTGREVACRMHLAGPKGRPVRVPKLPFWQDHFVFPGQVQLTLPLGNYTFELERGLEYLEQTGYFTINPFANDSHEVDLRRFVNMAAEGWWSGDLDVRRSPTDIELLMLADDLHVAEVITRTNDPASRKVESLPRKGLVRFDQNRYYDLLAGAESVSGTEVIYHQIQAPPVFPPGKAAPFALVQHVMEMKKKNPDVWIDVSRPFWWDLPTLVALGAVDSLQVAHSQLCRGSVIPHEAGGKSRDQSRYPDPYGNARWSQEIYFRLLECGLRIPLSAGSGSGAAPNPVGYNRVYVHVEGEFSYERFWENLRAGRVFITNGPLMRIAVRGQPPGYVFQASKGETLDLEIALTLSTRQTISYLEIIKNGKVAQEVRFADYAGSGRLPKLHFDRSGWFAVRAVTDSPKTYCFALSGPYFVEIGYRPRISKKAARFFLDWVDERIKQIKIDDVQQQQKVLDYYRQARIFWQDLAEKATAE